MKLQSNRKLGDLSLLSFFLLLSMHISYAQRNYATVLIKNISKVSGDVKVSGHQGKIEILKYALDLKDLGLKTSKCNITFLKPYDSSTIDLLRSYAENKEISSFEIEIFQKNDAIPEFKLRAESGKISNINYKYNELSKQQEEEVTMTFGKYKMTNNSSKQEVETLIQKVN